MLVQGRVPGPFSTHINPQKFQPEHRKEKTEGPYILKICTRRDNASCTVPKISPEKGLTNQKNTMQNSKRNQYQEEQNKAP